VDDAGRRKARSGKNHAPDKHCYEFSHSHSPFLVSCPRERFRGPL
jgi:hypothetical protein